jgi:Metallopeptidase family M24
VASALWDAQDAHRRLDVLRRTRRSAARALLEAIVETSSKFTELSLHSKWIERLARSPELVPYGWYAPPPHGYSVLVAQPPTFDRINFASLRDVGRWPRADVRFDSESLLFVYGSPIDRATGIIGDFQMTLYRGGNTDLQSYIAACLSTTVAVAEQVRMGMSFGELYLTAMEIIERAGLVNDTRSTTDVSGAANIGHTVPWFDGRDNSVLREAIAANDQEQVAAEVSSARRFLTAAEATVIDRDAAITIEPQLRTGSLPKASFHIIVAMVGGEPHYVTAFRPLLEYFGMMEYLHRRTLASPVLND